jgi:SAM-dependent methyltransferase
MSTLQENGNTMDHKLQQALWRIYRRPEHPIAWHQGGNLPWNDPAFSQRMLREHLDQSHGAASRIREERQLQIDWLWTKLGLQPGMRICDITCGPGLYAVEFARRGCLVTGIDFAPAAIAYARELAVREGVDERCTFIEQDVRELQLAEAAFDAALIWYGQLAVFPKAQAQQLLTTTVRALLPGGHLAIELLNQTRVDKTTTNWWFTDQTGLWGDTPFLHLGERHWDDEAKLSTERFYIIHLESGDLTEVHLTDQTYAVAEMSALMQQSGFSTVHSFPGWDGVPLYDAIEWVVYVAQK